ncbi:MAG TPA: DUF302 domain-containing protein [Candidatus Limnocylindrales bacterium]|nr:DUF302 domain-containing protein [Candidatus Limnocylindrales bacterium]
MFKKFKVYTFGIPLLTLALMGIFMLPTSLILAQDGRVEKVSNSPFDKTIKQLEDAITANKVMAVNKIDHQNMLTMVGMNIKGSKTYEVFRPDFGKILFESNPAAGLEIPLRIYVYENKEGKTVVSYHKPSVALAVYKNPKLDELGKTLDGILQAIADSATK